MSTVPELEAQLRQAKEAEAIKAREALIKELAETRAALRTARADYLSLSKRIRAGEQSAARIQAMVDELTAELTVSQENMPPVALILPRDEEVIDWRKNHDRLTARRDELIRQRAKVTSSIPPRIDAAKYEGNFGIIASLERSTTNLLRRLNGEKIGSSIEGGVYRVGA